MPELRSAAVYGVGETMVKGEADIALHQIPELMAVSRIEIVGPLPRDLHSITAFSPAVLATSKEAEVAKTLVEAVALVFLVMYLFMGNMRATLVPTIAVPVVLLGTFAVLWLFGFSINMLTMFAMVLCLPCASGRSDRD